jgi:endonuclease/exonuclease/phosphatase family metal-dependent hydrolase
VSELEPPELIDTRLRVLTWNIWWRFGPWEARAAAIAATLRRIDADVIGLQEVWDVDDGPGQAEALASDLGFHHLYAEGFDTGDAKFGNAILSRWPIVTSTARALPTTPETNEFRVALKAQIDGPRGLIHLTTTHLNWRFDESHVRQLQVRALAEFVAESRLPDYPPIVCGDFNADPRSDEIRMLTGRATVPVPRLVFLDAWEVAGDGAGLTWSNDNPYAVHDLEPDRRIDYVFVGWPKARGAGHVVSAQVEGIDPVHGVHPSDHYAVLAELRY